MFITCFTQTEGCSAKMSRSPPPLPSGSSSGSLSCFSGPSRPVEALEDDSHVYSGNVVLYFQTYTKLLFWLQGNEFISFKNKQTSE